MVMPEINLPPGLDQMEVDESGEADKANLDVTLKDFDQSLVTYRIVDANGEFLHLQ